MYYSEKGLKHFGLEILVIHGILEHITFKYIFWYKFTKIRKETKLNYSQRPFELYQVSQRFQYSQIVYIKSITQ